MTRLIYTDQLAEDSLGHIEDFGITSEKSDKLQQLETDLSNAGILSELDRLWVFKNNNIVASLVDLANGNYCRPQPGISYNQLTGFIGDGSKAYIDTQYNPAEDWNKYFITGASFGVYIPNEVTNPTTTTILGARTGATTDEDQVIMSYTGSGYIIARLNNDEFASFSTSSLQGFYLVNRDGSSVIIEENGTQVGSATLSDTGSRPSNNITLFALNEDSGQSSFQDLNIGLFYIGNKLNATARQNFNDAVQKYFT
ncbi:hypothetical protein [Schnuerera sp.]|uniref:hypothetical protein n=1 Tax=Schnuerera sp. TaxID=2794844 RepID=UPI002C6D75FA|nr:hypothetical protein [Schnuerera sp.]HSH36494.1 hypothetical protein [Schnuerera sp.]